MAPRKKASAASAAGAASQLSGQKIQSLGAFKFGGGRLATGDASSSDANAYAYDIPQHLRVYLHHIGKSDPRTREKAMRNLTEYLTGSPSDEDVQALLTYWSKQLPRLSLSAAACQLTLALSKAAGRSVGRVISEVFPPLFFGQFTQDAALSSAARDALEGMLGSKMDLAVCDVCFDRLLDAVEAIQASPHAASGASSAPISSSTTSYQPASLLEGARDILDRFKRTGKDPARMLEVMQGMDVKAWIRSADSDVRRHAYGTCMSLSAFSSSLEESFVRSVYGCMQEETDVANYADLMTMIIGFGRNAGTWAAIRDPEKDFHHPLQRIAASIDENDGLAKCFLPLLAVAPRDIWTGGQLAELLLAMLRAPKEARGTLRECLQYISTNDMVALVVDHVEAFAAEDTLRRLAPLLAAMDTGGESKQSTEAFGAFQVELLSRAIELDRPFWESGDVSFAYRIMENVGRDGLGAEHGDLNARLYELLVERAAISGIDNGLVNTIARIMDGKVATADVGADFDQIVQDLVARLGDGAAAKIVDHVSSTTSNGNKIWSTALPLVASRAVSTCDDDALALSKSLIRFSSGERQAVCLDECVGLAATAATSATSSIQMVLDLMAAVALRNPSALSSDSLLSFLFRAVWNAPDTPSTLSAAQTVFRTQDDISVAGRVLEQDIDDMHILENADDGTTGRDEMLGRLHSIVSFCVTSAKPGRHVAALLSFAKTLKRVPSVAVAVLAHQSTEFFAELVETDVDVALDALRWSSSAHLSAAVKASTEDAEDLLNLALSSPTSYIALIDRALDVTGGGDAEDVGDDIGDLGVVVTLVNRGMHLDEMLVWCRSALFAPDSVREAWRPSRLAALETAVLLVRSNTTLFEQSGLAAFSSAVLRAEVDGSAPHSLLGACFPDFWDDERVIASDDKDDPNDEAYERHLRSSVHNNGLIDWDELRPNMTVWYSGAALTPNTSPTLSPTANKATILSRDDSIQPPSFVVDLGGGTIRETEAGRLRLARVGPLLLGPPGVARRLLVDSAETDEAIRVLDAIIDGNGGNGGSNDATSTSLKALRALRPFGTHGWDCLGQSPDTRSALLDLVIRRTVQAASEMDASVASISEFVTQQANEATGATFGNSADAFELLATVRGNETLCRAPAMIQLHKRLRSALEDALMSFVEAHGEAVAAAVRIFLWDVWNVSKHREPGDKLASSIVSLFYGIGWMSAASRSVFSAPMDVWCSPDVVSMLRSLAAGVRAVDARRPDALGTAHGAPTRSLPSQILSLCLNGGISKPMAAAAFAVLLRRPDELAAVWSTDPDTFFGDVTDVVPGREEGDAGADDDAPLPLTRPRDKMVDLNPLVREALEGGADGGLASDDFHTAWLVLVAYLASDEVDKGQQEFLAIVLKDAGVSSVALSSALLEMLEVFKPIKSTSSQASKMRIESIDPTMSGSGLQQGELLTYLRQSSVDVPADVRMLFLLSSLPVAAREWYIDDLKVKEHKVRIEDFVKRSVAPLLIRREREALERACRDEGNKDDLGDNFTMKFTGSNAVLSMEIEEGASVELSVRFPSIFPLKAGTATLRTPGVSDETARRWQMSIELVLRNRSGDISEAIMLLRRNIRGKFEGVDACLICYSILDGSGAVCRRKCRTCGIKVHSSCLMRWMASSGKAECVHCRSPW